MQDGIFARKEGYRIGWVQDRREKRRNSFGTYSLMPLALSQSFSIFATLLSIRSRLELKLLLACETKRFWRFSACTETKFFVLLSRFYNCCIQQFI